MDVDDDLIPGFRDKAQTLLAAGVSRRRLTRWLFDVVAECCALRDGYAVPAERERECADAHRLEAYAWAGIHRPQLDLATGAGKSAARKAWDRARKRAAPAYVPAATADTYLSERRRSS